jgi:hypothetical protein
MKHQQRRNEMKQTEALRIAEILKRECALVASRDATEAAAELRRLHEANQAMLEALKSLADLYDTDEGCRSLPQYIAARAAIAKGEAK